MVKRGDTTQPSRKVGQTNSYVNDSKGINIIYNVSSSSYNHCKMFIGHTLVLTSGLSIETSWWQECSKVQNSNGGVPWLKKPVCVNNSCHYDYLIDQ